MSRAALRRAAIALTAALLLTVTFAPGAHAAEAGLTAVMLDTGDLPAGFSPDAALTGPLTGQRAQDLGLHPGQTAPPGTWVRTWLAADGSEVIETAIDAGTGDHARAGAASAVSILQKQGATRQPVAGLEVYGGFVGRYFELVLPLARGPYLFGLNVLVPASSTGSAGRLMSELGAAQVRIVPADTPDTAPASEAVGVAGLVSGVLIGYLLLAGGVGYLRDPLRRGLGRTGSRDVRRVGRVGPGPGGDGADDGADVSAAARRNFGIAAGRLAVQLAGLGLVAYAADVFQVRYWYAYLVAGLAVLWAGGRFIRPGGAARGRDRAVVAGPHRILVTGVRVAASAMILFGLGVIVSYGVYRIQPPGATVQGLPELGLRETGVPELGLREPGLLVLGLPGLGLLVLGVIGFVAARRLGSADAGRLMLRDSRPPVLYLRSFGDGSRKLRMATLGRPALVERFSLRRFGPFEEVLVRHLSRYGPVIAVNPPGTRLAPLRAARETVDPPAGHPAASWMAARMAQSALIVFQAPPSQATLNLHWELRTIAEHSQWDKALVVIPPVPAEQLRPRWRGFGLAYPGFWPYTVADPDALLLAFQHGGWNMTTADRRTEWSYAAALERVLGEPRGRPGPAVAPGPRRRADGGPRPQADAGPRLRAALGPLTLPVAALVVVAAAVMAGAGTWFALGQTPTAQLSAVAGQSAPPSLAPSAPSLHDGSASVGLAPAAARYPGATAIQAVISQYFQAINGRDYAAYRTTQSPGNALTEPQFQAEFASTQDSDVLVTGITTAPGGHPAADVTFTSRPQPKDGPDGESCTNWQVTMFFDGSAGSYTIGAPPTGYHASYQACS